jgi:hypothetical protein
MLYCVERHVEMPLHTSGRQQEIMKIPKAAHTVLYVPDVGRKNRPKHVER